LSSTEVRHATTPTRVDAKALRSFGLIVGGIFGVIGLWPLVVRSASPRLWALALGILLVGPALVAPRVLAPAHRLWMGLAELLGWINTRIVLSIVFFAVITPMGAVMRLLGKDPMRRGFERTASTYRVNRTARQPSHMLRQF
jgi:Saxitoxin biosynthesis operon protein SxtJ